MGADRVAGRRLPVRLPFHARKPSVGAFVGLYNEPLSFERLMAQREKLEAAFGEPLEWACNREGVVFKAWTKVPVANRNNRTDWRRQHAWLIDRHKRLQAVFGPPITDALTQYDPEAVDR